MSSATWPGSMRLRRPFSASTLLAIAFVLTLLPLVLLAAAGIAMWVAAEKESQLDSVARYSETLSRAIERELGDYERIAEVIGGSQFLQRGDIAAMNVIARDMVSRTGGHVVIMDRDGRHLVNTLFASEAALGTSRNPATLDAAFAAGKTIVSDIVIGTLTGRHLFGALAPVRVDGADRYVVGYVPPEGSMKKLLDDLVLPKGWYAAVIDGAGRIVGRSHDHEQFFGMPASPTFLQRLKGDRGILDSVDLQGRTSFTAYRHAGNWRAVVWVPKAIVNAPGNTAFWLMVAALAATLLFSAISARLVSGLFRKPVAHVVGAARDLGNGVDVPTVDTWMLEANLVGTVLHDAGKKIAAREAQLAASSEAVRESEQRYRDLVGGLRDAVVWEADPETLRFTFVSGAAEHLLGYPARQWLDDAGFWAAHLHPDDRDKAISSRIEAARADRNQDFEYRMITADGRPVWVRHSAYTSYRAGERVSRGLIVDISRAKAAEVVLRDNEQRFREMTENAPVMIWMSDATGRCIHLNRLLRQFWNVSTEGLIEFNWIETLHPDDVAEMGRRVAEAIAGRTGFTVQGRFRNTAGEYRILKTDAAPRFSATGEFVGLLGVNIDMTEALTATRQSRANEERLRIAADAAKLGVFEWRIPEDEAVFENQRMHAIFGHSHSEGRLSKQEFLLGYIHPDDRLDVQKQIAQAIAEGAGLRLTCRIRRKNDGEWRWIECAGNVTRGDDGKALRLVGVVADITERRLAEDQKMRSNALLRAVSDSSNDMIFVKDRACRLLFANPATARIIGIPLERLLGTTGAEWGHDMAEVEAFLANDRRVMETGQPQTVEEIFTGPGGTRTYMSEKIPMTDATGRVVGLIGICRDITERKEEEERTKLLLQEVSHRAKNMLAVTQAIIRQTARDLDPETFASRVTNRLDGLAASHDLLVESEWKSVNLRDLIEAQISHCRELIGSRIQIDGPQVRIRARAVQTLGMAMHELATNASKYGALSGPSGTVTVAWRITSDREGPVLEISWEERGGPPVTEPKRRGFGNAVIKRMVEHGLEARVSLDYDTFGVRWQARAPLAAVADKTEPRDLRAAEDRGVMA